MICAPALARAADEDNDTIWFRALQFNRKKNVTVDGTPGDSSDFLISLQEPMSATERTATLLLEPDISMSAQSAVCFKPVCWDSVEKWSRTGRLTLAAPGLDA